MSADVKKEEKGVNSQHSFYLSQTSFAFLLRHLAKCLEKNQPSTIPTSTYPRVIIVTEKIPLGVEREKEAEKAKKAFLLLLREGSQETTHDLSEQISDIHVVALGFLKRTKIGNEATYNLEFRLPFISEHLSLLIDSE